MYGFDQYQINNQVDEKQRILSGIGEAVDNNPKHKHDSQTQQQRAHHPEPIHIANCKRETN